MIKQSYKTWMARPFLGLAAVAVAISVYSWGPVAMAQVPAPPAIPDLPDVDNTDTPAPPTEADVQADAEVNADAKADTQADVQADAKANVQTDTDVNAPANRTNINADTDTNVQLDPNAPADINSRTRSRTRAGTQDPTDASQLPRLDADSRTQIDAEADLDNRRNDQGQANARTSQRGRLGIQFSGDDGLVISQLATGGIAARAGLRMRDEIVSINGQPVTTREDLTRLLSRQQGPTIIEFRRDGQLQQVNVDLVAVDEGARGDRVQSFYRGPEGGEPAYNNGTGGYVERSYGRQRRFYRSWRRCR